MKTLSIAQARRPESVGLSAKIQGWVRTRRDSKGGFSFIEVNDGSCFGNLQAIAEGTLANYESEIKHLSAGCSVTIEGEIKASGGKGQATEIVASKVIVHGLADPETYPLQKKQHSFEKLREWAHLRPRTNTFGAIARVRNCISKSIHDFFQEDGFLYVHAPIITASDCEGAGAMFRVSTLNPENPPRKTSSASRHFSLLAANSKAKSSLARWARFTRSAQPFAPRTPTPRATWPSSG
jgi:asparaginyl-tRNA synthetase